MHDRTGKKIILTCATALMHLVNQDVKKPAASSQEPPAGNSDGSTVAVLSILQEEVNRRTQKPIPSASPQKENERQKLIALKSALYFTKKGDQ